MSIWKVSTLVLALGKRVAEALAAVGENWLFGQLERARSAHSRHFMPQEEVKGEVATCR